MHIFTLGKDLYSIQSPPSRVPWRASSWPWPNLSLLTSNPCCGLEIPQFTPFFFFYLSGVAFYVLPIFSSKRVIFCIYLFATPAQRFNTMSKIVCKSHWISYFQIWITNLFLLVFPPLLIVMTVSTHKFVMNWWWYQVKALRFYAVPIFEDPTNSYPVIQVHLYSIIVFFFSTAPPRLQLPDRGPFHRYFFHWIPQHDGVRNPREHIYVYQLRQIFLVTIEEI